ncbi:hypothetical protein BJX63DRAFT_374638 [Aspergillus granulosus]|uniref:AAA+ ATPase domain-containing protein n=1 Tax=Aspergillus granulosus TaxID=176169 RepID=A0ABR4H0I5_9EURO
MAKVEATEVVDPAVSVEDEDSGVGIGETPAEEGKEPSSSTGKDDTENGAETKTVDKAAEESKSTTSEAKKSDEPSETGPAKVIFVDPVGTRWTFPFEKAKTWSGAKELVKIVYTDNFVPEKYAQLLDKENEGPEGAFSIVKLKPDETYILSKHWEELVSPGWEFKILLEGAWGILEEIRNAKKYEGSTTVKDEATEENDGPKISYVAKYLVPDDDGDLVYHSEQQFTEKITDKKTFGTEKKGTVLEEHREVSCHGKDPKAPPEKRIDNVGIPILYVRSQILHDALKAVISFQSVPDTYYSKRWRGRDITSSLEQGRFVYPFTDLWHYRHKLTEYRDQVKETHDPEYSESCRGAIDDMLGYLQDEPPIPVDEAELMWHHSTPKTKFNSLWLLLKPGSDVYVREQGQLNAYVVEGFTGGPQWTVPESRISPFRVHVWNLNFDGLILTRSSKVVIIPVFDGEREIRSLPVFPTEFHVDVDPENPLRQKLIDRGKNFIAMVKKPTLREYTGPSRLQGIREFTRARVVIDHTSQPWFLKHAANDFRDDKEAPLPVQTVPGVELGERTRVPGCPCKSCHANETQQQGIQRRKFDDYDDIDLNVKTDLTDHQYMLCWSHVYAFVLKDRVWDLLDVSHMEPPRIQKNIIDLLVMKPEGNKQMIKAICEIYGGTYTQSFSSDFISGKGEGQIILLHGPPGTGKTLTAESVAEYSGRPLLSLTSADLGQEPDALEQNLLRFFRDAKKWNAIVILDEADVYLEARSSQDLTRNSIVSIFLRALDYFQGILFLTTNRVGSFDEAFMSRIHVQIGYDPLDDGSRQQIWDNHFKKLSRNRELNGQEIRCSYDAKEFVRKSKELQVLKWNGREIRNAFQTAVALACYQAKQEGNDVPELTDDHLRQVVSMSQNFKTYLHNVRGAEEEMAYAARLRNDEAKASGRDN